MNSLKRERDFPFICLSMPYTYLTLICAAGGVYDFLNFEQT